MRLELLPDSDGYGVEMSASDVIENKLAGGFSARRRDLENVTKIFTVKWTCGHNKFQYLWKFYRDWLEDMQWFDVLLIDVVVNPVYPLQNHKAMFMPDSVRTVSVKGHTYVFSCKLEAYLDNPYPMSALYPVVAFDDLRINNPSATDGFFWQWPPEGLGILASLASGELIQQKLNKIEFGDGLLFTNAALQSGDLKQWVFHQYTWFDGLSIGAASLTAGSMRVQLVTYPNYEPEGLTLPNATLQQGTLT